MGWFDSIWGSRTSDPLGKLDPKVREFLEKESPIKYNRPGAQQDAPPQPAAPAPGQATAMTAPKQQQQQQQQQDVAAAKAQEEEEGGKPKVPKESLFQDGRYAHLWKTYRPLREIEAETKSDQDKLQDVLEAYKDRKSAIGQAALENCALEQVDWTECMKSGSVRAIGTLCRDEIRKFERCYDMQTRLLKALGYLSTYERTPEMEEQIQMHADKLFHRMLDQEAEAEAARREGRPVPKFDAVVPGGGGGGEASDDVWAKLNPKAREKYRKQLADVPEADRPAETAALEAELRAQADVAEKVQSLWKEQAEERKARKESGDETLRDKVASLFSPSSGGKP